MLAVPFLPANAAVGVHAVPQLAKLPSLPARIPVKLVHDLYGAFSLSLTIPCGTRLIVTAPFTVTLKVFDKILYLLFPANSTFIVELPTVLNAGVSITPSLSLNMFCTLPFIVTLNLAFLVVNKLSFCTCILAVQPRYNVVASISALKSCLRVVHDTILELLLPA